MSTFSRMMSDARSVNSGPETAMPPGFLEEFPTLAEALAGVPAGNGEEAIPPHSLTLFFRDGRLRFSLGSKDSFVCFFGEVEDAAKGLAGVEATLAAGRLGTKHEKRKR